MITTARKALASFVTVVTGWAAFVMHSAPHRITGDEKGLLVTGLATVFVTWLVPNDDMPSPWQPPIRGDRGQSTITVLVVVLLVLVTLRVFGVI